MIQIKSFIFNSFGVNTYVLSDETKHCVIVDPACYSATEKNELTNYIAQEGLLVTHVIVTHAHIDHIIGNTFVCSKYNLKPLAHTDSMFFWNTASEYANVFSMDLDEVITPEHFVMDEEAITFGNSVLRVLFTPGHATGSICLVCDSQAFVITGDVLFNQSIGRSDLPTGNYDLLRKSIFEKLFTLSDNYRVLPGHGIETTIRFEKENNPFL